jgi:hypothetical protein
MSKRRQHRAPKSAAKGHSFRQTRFARALFLSRKITERVHHARELHEHAVGCAIVEDRMR